MNLAWRVLGLAALLLAACSTTSTTKTDPADVHKSWDEAIVYVPGRAFTTSVNEVTVNRPMPVVLFMHGCAGITATETLWAGYLRGLGYIVVLPDSFARRRPPSCDPTLHRGDLFPGVVWYRQAEIAYALDKLQHSAWADPRNLFLMGHSEGAIVSSYASGSGFRGVILSGWYCAGGLAVGEDAGVLAIDHEHDPWFPNQNGRHCSRLFGNRANSMQVTLAGFHHDTFEQPARVAVSHFLAAHRTK